jgi:exopolysaccharide biosynthesis polyprenyl glycosylphosphotransferase
MASEKVNSENLVWAVLAIPLWILIAKIYSLYDRDHRRINHQTSDEIPMLISTAAIAVLLTKLISEPFSTPHLPSSAIVIIGPTAVALSIVLRSLVRRVYRRFSERERTIIVGSGPKAGLVASRLMRNANDRLELVGYIADSPSTDESGVPEDSDLDLLGGLGDLALAARSHNVTRVVIVDDGLDSRQTLRIMNVCREARAAVTMVPANHHVLGPDTELNRIAEVPMLDFHTSSPPRSTMAIKRIMDVTVSVFLLALAAPVLVISAAGIKIDSRGPVFFRQTRIGKDGRAFTIFKLRTMVVDAEEKLDELIDLNAVREPMFKIEDDPRVTRFGALLRRFSVDEIPQFINVLKGDMSLVGPRPEESAVVALYDERQRERLSVKPGLTGPMQIAGRGGLSFEERLALERDYLDNLTVTGDISILIRTPRAVVRGEGAF